MTEPTKGRFEVTHPPLQQVGRHNQAFDAAMDMVDRALRERVPEVRVVQVECTCGWKFATISLPWADAIMKSHACSRFIETGRDNTALVLAEELMRS